MTSATAVRIADFCKTGSGGTPSRSQLERYYEGGTIPWIKSGELREAVINNAAEYVTEAALRESSIKLVPAGAILLAMYGATVGRLGILGIEATTNQAVCHIVPDPKVAATRYVYHAISSRVPNLISMGVGGAQPNINQAIIKNLEIHLPPLPEQIRIAAILDQADALRVKRREALARLDSLSQAIFRNMFGDPSDRKFPRVQFTDVCERIFKGAFDLSASDYQSQGIPFVRISNIQGNTIELNDAVYISEAVHVRYIRSELIPGDIVFSKVGTIDRIAVIPNEIVRCNISQNNVGAKLIRSMVEPDFAIAQLTTPFALNKIRAGSKKAVQDKLILEELRALPFVLPPICEQKKYVDAVSSLKTLRALHLCASEQTEQLFAALQHSAFRGEL